MQIQSRIKIEPYFWERQNLVRKLEFKWREHIGTAPKLENCRFCLIYFSFPDSIELVQASTYRLDGIPGSQTCTFVSSPGSSRDPGKLHHSLLPSKRKTCHQPASCFHREPVLTDPHPLTPLQCWPLICQHCWPRLQPEGSFKREMLCRFLHSLCAKSTWVPSPSFPRLWLWILSPSRLPSSILFQGPPS